MFKTKSRGAGLIALAILASLGISAPARAETATLTGRVTDHTGAAAPVVSIFASNPDGTSSGSALTNASGAYRITGLKPGRFYVELRTTWGGMKRTGLFDVAGETVFDYRLPAIGSVAGRLTGQDGSGMASVGVHLTGVLHGVNTDANGDWRMERVFAGNDAIVSFTDFERGIQQYAYGKLSHTTADRITVTGDATTIVNEVVLPTGSVRVTAKDSVTGAPVAAFIASARFSSAETTTGEAILDNITVGTHRLQVDSPGYVAQDIRQVTVIAGEQVHVDVALTPEARIEVIVVDAATGAPLPGVCVTAVAPTLVPTEPCWNMSDETGRLTLGLLPARGYQLLAVPTGAPGYGAQWVGASGGTGRQFLAATVQAQAGRTVSAPMVRMDRAGTITGVVTKSDGSVPSFFGTVVGVLPAVRSSGELPPGAVGVDETGRYTLDFLGPYDWALFFTEFGEAAQYAGGVANPLLARTVRVTAGGSATYDFRFRAGVRLTVKVARSGFDNAPSIETINALSGYMMAHTQLPEINYESTFLVVGPQFVRFRAGDGRVAAGVHWIPSSGSKTVELTFG